MAFAETEAITACPFRFRWAMLENVVVKNANDLDQRQRRADMTTATFFDRVKNQTAKMFDFDRPAVDCCTAQDRSCKRTGVFRLFN